jgi:hypothetical protein
MEGLECDCVDNMCCDCWKEGCGCDGCLGVVADGLETVNPLMEYCADCIWCFGSPLAFPIIFCFPAGKTSGGWKVSMLKTPITVPIKCCLYTLCAPCGQWWMRRELLERDMSKYKLWQGYHDGPHCMAQKCPSAPCTIKSGTYGESQCPECFLCLEVTCLAGIWSTCCSFGVNRRMMKEQYSLTDDPTEVRVNSCVGFFSRLASALCGLSICVCCASCLVGCCAPDSEGAQECSGEGQRAAGACQSCAATCWRGIWSVKIIAMGCMSAQMDYEKREGGHPAPSAPPQEKMERGSEDNKRQGEGTLDDEDDADAWWKKP